MTVPTGISLVTDLSDFYAINGESSAGVRAKIQTKLDKHSKRFVELSPFLVLATSEAGANDASPRGDEPGFVIALDDTTLLIPERPGNRLADSMTNILKQPAVGLIFMVPGMNETLRINGDAYLTNEDELLEKLAHQGKAPKLGIIVDIKQTYFHCAKAFIRSKLWHVDTQIDRSEMPSLGKILLEQIKGESTNEEVSMVDADLARDAADNLYHQ